MKNRSYGMIIFLLVISLTLPSCSGNSSRRNCEDGICVDLVLQEPIYLNKPIPVTITVEALDENKQNLEVTLWFSDPNIQVEGESQWMSDIQINVPKQFSTSITIPDIGYIGIYSGALDKTGRMVIDSIPLRMTTEGGTLFPVNDNTPGPAPASRNTLVSTITPN